jgi:hypothetical protein
MFIVRRQDMFHPRGGASYLVKASNSYGSKYRMAKTAKVSASGFSTKRSAMRWADRVGGDVVAV